MNLNSIEQLSAISLLTVFLFGCAVGIFSGVVAGSRRGGLLRPASARPLRGALNAGAWAFYGLYVRDDDGYMHSLLPAGDWAPGEPLGQGESLGQGASGSQGQEAGR